MTEHSTLKSVGGSIAALVVALIALSAIGVGGVAASEVVNESVTVDHPDQERIEFDVNQSSGDTTTIAIRQDGVNVTDTTVSGQADKTVAVAAQGLSAGEYRAVAFTDDPANVVIENSTHVREIEDFVSLSNKSETDVVANIRFDASTLTNYTIEAEVQDKTQVVNSTTGSFDPVDYQDGVGWVEETITINSTEAETNNYSVRVISEPVSSYDASEVEEESSIFGFIGGFGGSDTTLIVALGALGVGYLYMRSRDDSMMSGGGRNGDR